MLFATLFYYIAKKAIYCPDLFIILIHTSNTFSTSDKPGIMRFFPDDEHFPHCLSIYMRKFLFNNFLDQPNCSMTEYNNCVNRSQESTMGSRRWRSWCREERPSLWTKPTGASFSIIEDAACVCFFKWTSERGHAVPSCAPYYSQCVCVVTITQFQKPQEQMGQNPHKSEPKIHCTHICDVTLGGEWR